MRIIDFFREKFNPSIVADFNDLLNNHSTAVSIFCSSSYLEPNLKKKSKSNIEKTPSEKSSFSTKAYLVSVRETILSNFTIEQNYINIEFDDLLNNHSEALELYCKSDYSEPSLKRKYRGKRHDKPIHNSPFARKQFFVSIKHTILSNYEIDIRYIHNLNLSIFFDNWETSQVEFSKVCRELRDQTLRGWGCYRYEVPFNKTNPEGKIIKGQFHVWQFFCTSFAPNDYLASAFGLKFYQEHVESRNLNPKFLNLERYYNDDVYEQIYSFIFRLKYKFVGDDSIIVIRFGDSGADNFKVLNDFHFKYLENRLLKSGYINRRFDITPKTNNFVTQPSRIIIVDFISTNERMVSVCKSIIDNLSNFAYNVCHKPDELKHCFANIVYISVRKEYSKAEMQVLIDKKKEEIKKEKEVQERERLERIRIENEKKRKQQIAREITDCTSNWFYSGSLRYFSIYNYYPTTCYFDASEDEWDVRKLIWNFKAAPNRPESLTETITKHKMSVRRIVPILSYCLKYFFGASNLKFITFACVPASSRTKTERRFKDFSQSICDELGMTNAYPYIKITTDGTAKHLGGSDDAEIELDRDFFKDRLVILFDDVITRGETMRKFKASLERAGAQVIGGISIGRTKHERAENPIDIIAQFKS